MVDEKSIIRHGTFRCNILLVNRVKWCVVHSIIQVAQSKHGLRQEEYHRYRYRFSSAIADML
jgi:hypothetical protein